MAPTPPPTHVVDGSPVLRRRLHRLTTGITTAGLVLVLAPLALPGGSATPRPAPAPDRAVAAVPGTASELVPVSHRVRHPHRIIKRYRVRPGDTAGSIAVRYHAWTAELIRMNHGSTLYAGEVVRIPVVPQAQRACTRHRHHRTHVGPRPTKAHRPHKSHKPQKPQKAHRPHKSHKPHKPQKAHRPHKSQKPQKPPRHQPTAPAWRSHRDTHLRGWHHGGATRDQVRRVVVSNARHFGVNPDLALAIAWQESGWQQRRVSSAGALGAMQVLPGTATWMSGLVGYRLNPRDLHHNVVAGVRLIRWLRDNAGLRRSIAGYYQGLAGVRKHGMYPSTRRYVDNVLALRRSISRGGTPY